MRFFTADLHLGHINILKHDERPFRNITEHDQKLVEYWNDEVDGGDEVYVVGDFSYKCSTGYAINLASRLNGGRIYLIQGNHDGGRLRSIAEAMPNRFEFLGAYHEIKDTDRHIVLCHYPIASWNRAHYGSWHIHGHVHGSLGHQTWTRIDVGVNVSGYRPVSEERVDAYMKAKLQLRKPRAEGTTDKRAHDVNQAGIVAFEKGCLR